MKRETGSLIALAGLLFSLPLAGKAVSGESPAVKSGFTAAPPASHSLLQEGTCFSESFRPASQLLMASRSITWFRIPETAAEPLQGWTVITDKGKLLPDPHPNEFGSRLKQWIDVEEIRQAARQAALNQALRPRISIKKQRSTSSSRERRLLRWLRFRSPKPEPPAPLDTTFTEANARAPYGRE